MCAFFYKKRYTIHSIQLFDFISLRQIFFLKVIDSHEVKRELYLSPDTWLGIDSCLFVWHWYWSAVSFTSPIYFLLFLETTFPVQSITCHLQALLIYNGKGFMTLDLGKSPLGIIIWEQDVHCLMRVFMATIIYLALAYFLWREAYSNDVKKQSWNQTLDVLYLSLHIHIHIWQINMVMKWRHTHREHQPQGI